MSYPEKIPSDNPKSSNFIFSFEKAAASAQQLKSDYSLLEERIDKIISSEKFHVSDFPVLRQIMMLNPSKNELKLLSKALDRLSELVHSYQSISQKLSVFKIIEEDPHWLTLSFGDFAAEIDNDIHSLFNSTESE